MLLSCCSLATVFISENGNDLSYKNLFILAGQSNMAGRGYFGDDNSTNPPPLGYFDSHPQILVLDANQTWNVATEYGPDQYYLHYGIDLVRYLGVGPGMPFANWILIKDPGFGTIGLIPCAHGNTQIVQWSKGNDRGLYDQLVYRAKVALESGGKIKALLWYQGESDAETYEDATLYGSRLAKFLTDVRADLEMPDLPVLVVAMMTGVGEYKMMVRQAQMDIKLPHVVTVDAMGAEIKPYDKAHLNLAGIVEVGKRLADTFLEINGKC
ncbi:putative carbohydrate esterase-like [Dorcoceras hygrometricum]|uniref:Putative carbohydrate esterase-like n=1 Tax=Dorcoceras hygrometricum TaxID=472368 RepID=A0A2Z7B1G2_9LAMI|nr:putative carbohydrate esterase-like [Dorcoceras hygrometricum]